jgi:glycosyltransferase involved in cell wall biosynthesis
MKLLYITNIPTPYRQKRFNRLSQLLLQNGIELEVLYMAKTEPNRNWVVKKDTFKYSYNIYKGIHPIVGGMFAHFNPSLLIRLLKNDYQMAIVGGMASPTHWLAPFFISKNKVQIMSIESNLHSIKRTSGFSAWIKKILLKKANAYQVTGSPQIKYIEKFIGKIHTPIIKLPNLINEAVFKSKVEELKNDKDFLRDKFEVDRKTQMWVIPARLISIKGVLPFIIALKDIKNIKLFILGDGELKAEIEKTIINLNLPVVCVGFVSEEDVIKYYAASDLFILPSLKDPSPLSPIEACAAGLPILVSDRIGNLEDVLEDNKNGWSFDPGSLDVSFVLRLKQISEISRNDLEMMGNESKRIYNDRFNTDKCLLDYISNLKHLYKNG